MQDFGTTVEEVAEKERQDPDSPIVEDATTKAVAQTGLRIVNRLAREHLPGPFDMIVGTGIGMLANFINGQDLSIGHW